MNKSRNKSRNKSSLKLTRKQKAFANHLLNNPKDSATKAALATYNANEHSAMVIGSENLRNPAIQFYLEEHVDKAKMKMIELIDNDKPDIALRSSESVLNRALGMPTQRQEVHTTVVTLGLSLTDITDK